MNPSIGGGGTTAISPPSSNMYVGAAGDKLLSIYDTVTGLVDPNNLPEIFQTYGRGIWMRDVWYAKGYMRDVPSNDLNVFEELSWQRPIKVKTAVSTTTATNLVTIVLHADNYEATTKNPVQVNDKILLPSQYLGGTTTSEEVVVMSRSKGTLDNDTLVCYFLNSAAYVATAIPASTQLAPSGNSWARATDQPQGKVDYPVQKSYTPGICKATVAVAQDAVAYKLNPASYQGYHWLINDLTMKADRDLDLYLDQMHHHGQKNTNTSNLTMTSVMDSSDSGIIRSSEGLVNILDTYGMCGYYDTTFGYSDLTVITDGFIAQGIPTTEIAAYVGHIFNNAVDDMMRDYMKAYSHGSDLYDRVKNLLGVSPTTLNWNNFNFYFQQMSTLSNPANIGVTSSGDPVYEYGASGIFIPDSPITVGKFGTEVNASIPHVGIGQVNFNGENNGRIAVIRKGVTNLVDGQASMATAGLFYYYLAEEELFGGAWNQIFYERKLAS
jgi:hypothetical protein